MTIIQAVILGVIQGFTEFLPVSSSGHLIFLPKLFGWADQGMAFDTIVHLGTLVAVVIYFRGKIWNLIVSFFDYNKETRNWNLETRGERRLGWLIILSVIPAGVVGLFFADWLEINFRAPVFVGINMIFWALVLYFADQYACAPTHPHTSMLGKLNWKSSLFIGCAQAIALIPGTSRSGITMTAGMFAKLNKESAVEFTFLMSVPIIALAGADGLFKIIRHGAGTVSYFSLGMGFIAATVSGWLAIDILLKIIKKWSFTPFVLYRIIVGILILILL